ncbi:MAG: IS66 family insertion sequence element accessory protein TnpA [Opitutaceae bacterium]
MEIEAIEQAPRRFYSRIAVGIGDEFVTDREVFPVGPRRARRRRRWTAEEKAEHLALFADSGLSQVEYCEQMGLSPATFSLWCRQSRVAGEA